MNDMTIAQEEVFGPWNWAKAGVGMRSKSVRFSVVISIIIVLLPDKI